MRPQCQLKKRRLNTVASSLRALASKTLRPTASSWKARPRSSVSDLDTSFLHEKKTPAARPGFFFGCIAQRRQFSPDHLVNSFVTVLRNNRCAAKHRSVEQYAPNRFSQDVQC